MDIYLHIQRSRNDLTCQARRRISSQQKGQHKSCNKPTDVRHVRHAARVRCVGNGTDAAEKLQDDPAAYDNESRYRGYNPAYQHFDLLLREHQNVSAERSRNRS